MFLVCLRVEMVRGETDIEILMSSSNCDQEQNREVCLHVNDNTRCVFSDEKC